MPPPEPPSHRPGRRSLIDVLLGGSVLGLLGSIVFPVLKYLKPLGAGGQGDPIKLSPEEVKKLEREHMLVLRADRAFKGPFACVGPGGAASDNGDSVNAGEAHRPTPPPRPAASLTWSDSVGTSYGPANASASTTERVPVLGLTTNQTGASLRGQPVTFSVTAQDRGSGDATQVTIG